MLDINEFAAGLNDLIAEKRIALAMSKALIDRLDRLQKDYELLKATNTSLRADLEEESKCRHIVERLRTHFTDPDLGGEMSESRDQDAWGLGWDQGWNSCRRAVLQMLPA